MLRLKLSHGAEASAQVVEVQSQEVVRDKLKNKERPKEGKLASGVTVKPTTGWPSSGVCESPLYYPCGAKPQATARPSYRASEPPLFFPCAVKPPAAAVPSNEVCFIPMQPLPACYENDPNNHVYTTHQLQLLQHRKESKAVQKLLDTHLLHGLGPSIGEEATQFMQWGKRGPRENGENVCCILLPYMPYIKACYEHSLKNFKICQKKMVDLVEEYYGQVGDKKLLEKARQGRLAHFDDH